MKFLHQSADSALANHNSAARFIYQEMPRPSAEELSQVERTPEQQANFATLMEHVDTALEELRDNPMLSVAQVEDALYIEPGTTDIKLRIVGGPGAAVQDVLVTRLPNRQDRVGNTVINSVDADALHAALGWSPEGVMAAINYELASRLERDAAAAEVEEPAAETAAESYDINEADREQVRSVQNLLNRAGFNSGRADGLVGRRTLGALRSAQEAAGLDPESTNVTPALVDFLNNKIQQAERAAYVARGVEQNRSDRDFIREVQTLVKPADASDGWVDGSWGPASRRALEAAGADVLNQVEALVQQQTVDAHLEAARQALGAERAAEIDALIENGASIDELAALTSPDAAGGMSNRNLVAQYLQAKYEADGTDFSELAVAIMEQYECPEGHTVRDALLPAQRGDDERYFRDFDRNGRESYYRVGYRVKQNELVRSVENSEVSLTVGEAYNEENNTITIGDQVVALPPNARLHMATGNEAGRADGWMDMTMLQAGDFELSNVVYDEQSGAIYFIMNNGCHGNPGVITVEQGLIPLPPAPTPSRTTERVVVPEQPDTPTRQPRYATRRCRTRCDGDDRIKECRVTYNDTGEVYQDWYEVQRWRNAAGCRDTGCCFPAGTKVSMADGTKKNIEDIAIGEVVTAYDLESGQQKDAQVLDLESPVRDALYTLNDGLLKTTDDHPIYVTKPDGRTEWASVDPEASLRHNYVNYLILPLEVGDKVHMEDGSLVEIESITETKGDIQTYNLSNIANYHTFYADGVLVHNKNEGCCGGHGTSGSDGPGNGNTGGI